LLFPALAKAQLYPSQFELSSSVHLDEVDSAGRTHLERVKAYLSDSQWDEAVETLRQIAENYGAKVIQFADRRYINVADYCHAQLGALPPDALKLYRERVDPLAEKWYTDAIAQHDRARLVLLTHQMFCSSWGDDALLALGEMSLEQGEYGLARNYWERLVETPPLRVPPDRFEQARTRPDVPATTLQLLADRYEPYPSENPRFYQLKMFAPNKSVPPLSDADAAVLVNLWKSEGLPPTRLAYPGTSLPLADIRARLVLVSIMEGALERARGELVAFGKLHAEASGVLGGRKTNLATALDELLSSAEKWQAEQQSPDWATFAGSASRNHVAPGTLDLGTPLWPAIELGEPLAADINNSKIISSRRIAEDTNALLSYHPLVVNDVILINNSTEILAFNLKTGQPNWPRDPKVVPTPGSIYSDETRAFPSGRGSRGLGVPRFTMTVADQKLYARMGSQITTRPVESFDNQSGSLVCLDLGASGGPRLLWKITPDDDKWSFEGSPLVDRGEVYIAMRHSDVRPQAHIACFDAETGLRRWRTMICSAETVGGGQLEEMTHNLLTLEQGMLYLNTNLGAVAAVTARDGIVQWVSLYERVKKASSDGQDKRAAHFYRDLNPCVYHQGTLFVAPTDSDRIFAFDALTGQMLWASNGEEVAVHLLGVAGGNLIATGDKLYWLNAAGGQIVGEWPHTSPIGLGRGLLLGDQIVWPTREALYQLPQSGSPTSHDARLKAPIPLHAHGGASGGNLVIADGVLLIATAEKLFGFNQQGKPPSKPTKD